MTPEIMAIIDEVVSREHHMNLIELEHMAIDQAEHYPGFKRQHRFLSRWRNESAIKLTNFVIDHYAYRPTVSVSFVSGPPPTNYLDGIKRIIAEYEALRLLYIRLARQALAENADELMQFAEKAVCWIAKTKMKYHRDMTESAGKTPDYIQFRSEHMHEKYRTKEKEFVVEI